MDTTRRDTLKIALASVGATLPGAATAGRSVTPASSMTTNTSPRWGMGVEGQRRPDLGNGTYRNPVLAGDRPDPNVLKDGKDYYATFSSFLYYPGVTIWHSRDLVNWTPVTAALKKYIGNIWALDIAKHGERFFIYIPALSTDGGGIKTYVIHAQRMQGPWSEPIDLKIEGAIDPGHAVGEDGKRYLFLNGGRRVRLTDDGLATDGPVEQVYNGWPIPADWIVEGFALEGPKLLNKDGWFYYFSGEGGTAGPPTSHMVVVARSRSINGPWENCPHNPIVHTASRHEPWWSRGHATAVEGPDGRWWLVYHGYENGFRTLGRQMLLEPIEWTADGWPRATGGDLSQPLALPARGHAGASGQPLSGFKTDMWGIKLAHFAPQPDYAERARLSGDRLTVAAQGTGPADSSPLVFVAGDRAYEVEVVVEVEPGAQGGLLLFYDHKLFCGLGLGDGRLHAWRIGQEERYPPGATLSARRLRLRLVNDENVVTFYYATEQDRSWTKERSFEVSGYNHNVADGFLSLRPALYAAGQGGVTFGGLTYRAVMPGVTTGGRALA